MKYLILKEAAQFARTNVSTVRWWIQTGRLASFKPGRRRLVACDDLEAFIQTNGTHGRRKVGMP